MRLIFVLIYISICLLIMAHSYYWQLIPLALLSVSFAISILFLRKTVVFKKLSKAFWVSSFGLVLIGTIGILVLLPFFNLPKPSGSFSIGTQYITLTDTSRIDDLSEGANEYREIHSQIWYPATDLYNVKPERYIPDAKVYSKLFAKTQGIPFASFILNHLGATKTHSYLEVPAINSEEKIPVVIFSHGMQQFYKFNTILIEELVSHSYIVIAISHPYDTPCAINSNNELVIYNASKPKTVEDKKSNTDIDFENLHSRIESSDSSAELKELYKVFYENMPGDWNQQNENWLVDLQFTKSSLDSLNRKILNNTMDLNAVGVLGFSFGGGVAGLAAMTDTTIKAGISLDGWQPGHTYESYFNNPFMLISSEQHKGANEFFLKYSEGLVIDASIAGTHHTNFNDMAIVSGKFGKLLRHTGSIDGEYGIGILKDIVIRYFNQYLKEDEQADIIETLNQHKELQYKTNRK